MHDCRKCPRGLVDREPLSNVLSDTHEADGVDQTFFCAGYNNHSDRNVQQDRFCFCIKSNDGVNVFHRADRRDFLCQLRVVAAALETDENIRVFDELTDDQMNNTDLVSIMRGG